MQWGSAAPALAASALKPYTVTVTASGHTAATQTVTIPANATNISYTVTGGGGGSYGDKYDRPAGSGSTVTGTLDISGCGTAVDLFLIAGGGGDTSGAAATGFGNGGPATRLTKPADLTTNDSGSVAWAAGGGAGSAISFGGAPNAGGTLITVAGGGRWWRCAHQLQRGGRAVGGLCERRCRWFCERW